MKYKEKFEPELLARELSKILFNKTDCFVKKLLSEKKEITKEWLDCAVLNAIGDFTLNIIAAFTQGNEDAENKIFELFILILKKSMMSKIANIWKRRIN